MRFLVDQNVPRNVIDGLREDRHDVTWVQTAQPGADDEALFRYAREEDRLFCLPSTQTSEPLLSIGTSRLLLEFSSSGSRSLPPRLWQRPSEM